MISPLYQSRRCVAAKPAVIPAVAPATKASAAAEENGTNNGARKNILYNLPKFNQYYYT